MKWITISIALAVIISIVLAIIISTVFCYLNRKKIEAQKEWVLENDERIIALKELNNRFKFEVFSEVQYLSKSVKSKRQAEVFDYTKFLYTTLKENIRYWERLVKCAETNEIKYKEYKNQLKQLPQISVSAAGRLQLSFDKYKALETEIYYENLLCPPLSFEVRCKVFYSSPQGRSCVEYEHIYGRSEISRCLNDIRFEEKEKNSEENRRKEERNKMKLGLRYDIMKRDGFRCVLCGRSASDGIKLHVDHIVPVSRGGKTEESNLRTLCEECNLGKGDKIGE